MAVLKSLKIDDTGNLSPPAGTTAQRPSISETLDSFTTVGSTTWTCPAGVTQVQVLVVAGGGGGASRHGGGGGAGGVVYNPAYPVVPGTSYTVVVGSGGSGAVAGGNTTGSTGGNSQFDTLVAQGGGFGTSNSTGTVAQVLAGAGGSGGGARGNSPNNGGAGISGQGHKGGNGALQIAMDNAEGMGGGGGGAGGPGYDGWFERGIRGNGGPGLPFTITGSTVFYAGGGGAGCETSFGNFSSGGIGGGGSGGGANGSGENGTANTGGGGGAGGHTDAGIGNQVGGNGGSGVVHIRYSATTLDDNPTGKTRWNSNTQKLEVYGVDDDWQNPESSTNGIVTSGLVMNLDAANYGAGSTWLDSSGNGYHATIFGSSVYSTDNGGKFDFGNVDQTSQYISLEANAAQLIDDCWTLEFWMQPVSPSTGATSYWSSMAQPGNDNYNIWNQTASSLGHYTQGGGVNYTSGEILHLMYVRSRNGETSVYKNGRKENVQTGMNALNGVADGGWILNQEQDAVGGGFSSTQNYRGAFMQVRLYAKALEKYEVEQNYNATCGRYNLPQIPLETGVTKRGLVANLDAGHPSAYQETRSTWFDISGNGNHAVLTAPYGYVHGRNGYFKFNGTTGAGGVATIQSIPFVEQQTLECLWKARSTDVHDTYGRIMDYGDTTMSLGTYATYQFRNWVNVAGGRTAELIRNGVGQDNLWHHTAMTFDGNWFILYFDGVAIGTTERTGDLSTTSGIITIGNGDAEEFSGDIAVARVYKAALTPSEIRFNYEELMKRYGNR